MKALIALACLTLLHARFVHDAYSFDYSAHQMPLMWSSYGNAVELSHKVKLNTEVALKGGAYVLDRPITFPEIEVDIEFSINTDLDKARGFQAILSRNEF